MHPALRQLPPILITGMIVFLIYSRSIMLLVPWWAFVLTLTVTFFAVDYGIQMLLIKIKANKTA